MATLNESVFLEKIFLIIALKHRAQGEAQTWFPRVLLSISLTTGVGRQNSSPTKEPKVES